MDIDSRLEALTVSVELLTHNVQAMQDEQRRLERRDRRLRNAILQGVVTLMQELAADIDDDETPQQA